MVRPHSECLTGDVLGQPALRLRTAAGEAVERIADVGGYLLYLRQEGRGIGLYAKLDAYALQTSAWTRSRPTWRWATPRTSVTNAVAAQMLVAVGADPGSPC